ncbi:MAG: hypothetical protein KGM44_01045 [bacterium]|nr:hypothetical protein [bacterium]
MPIRLLLLLVATLLAPAAARAETIDVPVASQALVRIEVQQADVVIQGVPGERLRISAPRAQIQRESYTPTPGDNAIRILPVGVQTAQGRHLDLPGETFAYTPLSPGPHAAFVVTGGFAGRITVALPEQAGIVLVKMERGRLMARGVRNGGLLAELDHGAIALSRFSGTAYLQVAGGPISVAGSQLEHVRLRTGAGAIVVRNSTVAQLQASSILGDVIVDDATFLPGLARLESREGAVALGVGAGGAQVTGSTGSGRVFTMLDGEGQPRIDRGGVSTLVHGGGPAVTLRSESGSLFLYGGSLDGATLPPAWRRMGALLRRFEAPRRFETPQRRPRRLRLEQAPRAPDQSRNLRSTSTSSLNVCCGRVASTR